MQKGRDTIPIGTKASGMKNRIPGAVAFVENFDTDDDSESPDILSFESLRKAFATLQNVETELAQTIPEIGLSAEQQPETSEQPDYEIDDDTTESENYASPLSDSIENSATVSTRFEAIIEAMLFVGNRENRPLNAEQVAEKLRNVSAEDVDQAIARLNELYQERNRPYTIIPERNGYRMTLRSEFEAVRANFYGKVRGARLSQQAIDTLAVVAYRQPITAEEIQNIRRQPCSTVLNQLVRRNLLKISREMRDEQKVAFYHTTSRFLELFQIKSLDDIPKTDELDYR